MKDRPRERGGAGSPGGRKRLTLENLLEADKASTFLATVNTRTGVVRRPSASDWARSFLAIELDDRVPAPVRELFDAARGALIYGFFFYPLYALGEDQLYRVADAALTSRFRAAGGQMRKRMVRTPAEPEPTEREEAPPFAERLEFLASHDVLPPEAENWWRLTWDMRNVTSHPHLSRLGPPSEALRTLRSVASRIDALFTPQSGS